MEAAEPKVIEEGTAEQASRRGDWERSEWFRLWLELIRQPSTQGTAH